jgi:type IV pilus assembly protein PilM
MLRNSSSRFFPTPSFLEEPSFGLDISDESVKFVELTTTKKGIKLGRHGERKIPAGIIESGKIKNSSKMEEILIALKKEEGIKSVRVSLPEEQVYMFKLNLEKNGLNDIREGIELSLEEHIPIPTEDTVFDYEILKENDNSLELQIAAISRNVAENYLSIFKNSLISVQSFELEAQAISRAVNKKGDAETYMIVDFGEKRTGIFIVSSGVVMFASTLDFGGLTLSNMVMKSFNISFAEAEKMKQQYGLQRNLENKEIFAVLLNGVSILRDEISKHFLYWHTHKDEEGNANSTIKKIILCGGDSNLIGFSDYLSVSMKSKVEIANVWCNIIGTQDYIPDISLSKSLSYATALGLALGDFEHD